MQKQGGANEPDWLLFSAASPGYGPASRISPGCPEGGFKLNRRQIAFTHAQLQPPNQVMIKPNMINQTKKFH